MPVVKAKGPQRINMRREQIERFLASSSTVSEWRALNKVSESTLYKWMAYFREMEPESFGSGNASRWIEVSRTELSASTALAVKADAPANPAALSARHPGASEEAPRKTPRGQILALTTPDSPSGRAATFAPGLVERFEDGVDRARFLACAALGAQVVVDVSLRQVDGPHRANLKAFAAVVALVRYGKHGSPFTRCPKQFDHAILLDRGRLRLRRSCMIAWSAL